MKIVRSFLGKLEVVIKTSKQYTASDRGCESYAYFDLFVPSISGTLTFAFISAT